MSGRGDGEKDSEGLRSRFGGCSFRNIGVGILTQRAQSSRRRKCEMAVCHLVAARVAL